MSEYVKRKAKMEATPEWLADAAGLGFDPVFFRVLGAGRHNVTGAHVVLVESDTIPAELHDQWVNLSIVKIGDDPSKPVSQNFRPIWSRKQ